MFVPGGAIPKLLLAIPQWVAWVFKAMPSGKPSKVPISPATGRPASVTDPSTWGSYEEATRVHRADGVGFVFTALDEYVGIDLDGCRDASTGEIEPWAQEIVDALDSYTEISPSSTGVHVLVRGKLPPGGRRKGKVEMYDEGRFFTMTGNALAGTPSEVMERTEALASVHAKVFDTPQSSAASASTSSSAAIVRIDVRSKLKRLMAGDWSGYPSQSEADLALCSLLARETDDPDAIDATFRASGLYRPKWDEKRGDRTYGEKTIARALDTTGDSPSVTRPRTELGNAERLVDAHGEDLHYIASMDTWTVWNGTCWRPDATGEVQRLAKSVVREIQHEVAHAASPAEALEIVKWAKTSESLRQIGAMLQLARSELPIPARAEDLDADPWLLNVRNGTIDLKTGKLRAHRREDLITKVAPVEFDPKARPDTWDRFLERVIPDPEVRAYVQRAVGSSLVGVPTEDALFLVHGPTRTGKSTFIGALRATLGDYAAVTDFEALVKRKNVGGARNDIARLRGARLVVASEVERGHELAVNLVKSLTGGDTITARFLYQEAFEFAPQLTLWIATNHLPEVPHDDGAIWERIRVVPFTVTVPSEERDPQVRAMLANASVAGPAILAWAVEGCLAWQRDGLAVPVAVEVAMTSYRDAMDPLAAFIKERCVLVSDAWTSSAELRGAYVELCEEQGDPPVALGEFHKGLRAHGLVPHKRHTARGWSGVRLA